MILENFSDSVRSFSEFVSKKARLWKLVKYDPKELNQSSIMIEWDDRNKKEIDDAKEIYIKAKLEQRRITDLGGEKIECFKPDLCAIKIQPSSFRPGRLFP